MQQDEKVDLTSVNKTKKQFKLPVLKNPFKKQVGPKRDEVGKFTSGSGGLLSNKKFNFRRAIPLVAVVALVGGFFVFRSFAAVTKPPAYQYSITTCPSSDKDTTCKDKSAEALVYRIQMAALGRQTEHGYKDWTQKLAGDRVPIDHVSKEAEGSTESRWGGLSNKAYVDKVAAVATPAQRAEWTKQIDQKKMSRVELAQNFANLFKTSTNKILLTSYKQTNKQFVESIFKNLLKRGETFVASPTDSWLKGLNEEKLTRADVVLGIAKSQEAINKSRGDLDKYLATVPKLRIVQTAKQKQVARSKESAQIAIKAKIHYEGSLGQLKLAAPLVSKANNQAAASVQTSATLNAINGIKAQAQKHLQNAQGSAKNSNAQYARAEAILKEARSVSKYSPDIPSTAVESARNQAAVHAAQANNKANDIKNHIAQISNSYKVAEGKYKAEQARIAAEKARAAAPQQNNPSGSGNCGTVSASSGNSAIKAFQRCKGIAADGIWGPQTCRAAGRSDCGGVAPATPAVPVTPGNGSVAPYASPLRASCPSSAWAGPKSNSYSSSSAGYNAYFCTMSSSSAGRKIAASIQCPQGYQSTQNSKSESYCKRN